MKRLGVPKITGAIGLAFVAGFAGFSLRQPTVRKTLQDPPPASLRGDLPAVASTSGSAPEAGPAEPAPVPEPVVASGAAPTAEKILSPEEKLAAALRDYRAATDNETRVQAISTITELAGDDGGLKPEKIAAELGGLFYATPDATLKADILMHLASVETPSALDPILAGLRPDQPTEVRAAAAAAAGILGDKRALGYVRQLTVDRSPEIADAAKAAIEEINAPTE